MRPASEFTWECPTCGGVIVERCDWADCGHLDCWDKEECLRPPDTTARCTLCDDGAA